MWPVCRLIMFAMYPGALTSRVSLNDPLDCGLWLVLVAQRSHESCSFICQSMAPHQYFVFYYWIVRYIIFYFHSITNIEEHKRKRKYVGVAEWYDNTFIVACNWKFLTITEFWDTQWLPKLELHIKCITHLFNFGIINFS